ncbi:hypothetical protein AAMO2058_001228300 [Amorphochlora amoebiformis]
MSLLPYDRVSDITFTYCHNIFCYYIFLLVWIGAGKCIQGSGQEQNKDFCIKNEEISWKLKVIIQDAIGGTEYISSSPCWNTKFETAPGPARKREVRCETESPLDSLVSKMLEKQIKQYFEYLRSKKTALDQLCKIVTRNTVQ